MTPIINPLWFYIISIGAGLKDFFFWGGFVFLIIFFGCFLYVFYCYEDRILKEKEAKDHILKNKSLAIIGAVFIFLSAFAPSKETCYQMMAASVVTEENIEKVGTTATNVIDYIIESVDHLLNEDEEGK